MASSYIVDIPNLVVFFDQYEQSELEFDPEDNTKRLFIIRNHNEKLVSDYIYQKSMDKNLSRGDIVDTIPEEKRYRNDGKFIWNGEKALELFGDYDIEGIDEYGFAPPEFEVSESNFSPWYWKDCLVHNNYYWPCLNYRQQVISSLCYDDMITENLSWRGYFFYHSSQIHVIVENQSGEEMDKNEIISKILDTNVPFDWNGENSLDLHREYEDSMNISCIFL